MIYVLITLNSLFVCGLYYVNNLLGDVNFHELAYQMFNPGSSAGLKTVVWDAIKPCIWIFILSFSLLFIIVKTIDNYFYIIVFLTLLLVLFIIVLLQSLGFFKYIIDICRKTKLYEEDYVDSNKVNITFPNKKKNLIMIYLESTEASLFSKENGGYFDKSRIIELEKIAKENINFSNSEKLGGGFTFNKTSFTAGALVASTSGVPINTRLFNVYNDKNRFMKNVRTLGDVLRENGYNLELVQGSDINFAKENMYLKEHGNYKLFDDSTAKKLGYIDEDYYVWWGMEDKKTLEYAKKEIINLSKQDKPFALTLFTIDTHFKDGYVDDSFKPIFDDHYSNSYASSSKMISEFLNWLKNQNFYNDTVVILTGDHITCQNSFYKKNKKYERTIYNAFLNVHKSGNFKNRKFSMLDMYPTILSSLGVSIEGDRLGLGTDLFSGKKTIIEKYGKDKFMKEILKTSKYYNDNLK